MSLRGAASIIGIGELKPERRKPGRTGPGLAQEAARLCIEDAGLLKEEVDGLITEIPFANTCEFAELLGIQPTWAHGVNMMGSSGPTSVAIAAMAVNAGLANNVLCLVTSGEAGGFGGGGGGGPVGNQTSQWAGPFGPGPGANFWYALVANRYKHEFGLTDEERVAIAVQQRENAQGNPEAAFYGTPATTDDILNSRMVANPLTLLECVMPTLGAAALMVSRPEAARSSPHGPVYILGVGHSMDRGVPGITYVDRMTKSPVEISARAAYKMAGVGPADMDIASLYDCYTITVIIEFEDAGFAPKGEGGKYFASEDVTYKSNGIAVNTHGGQLSFGQPGTAGGMSHATEAVRQLMGRGEGRQKETVDYCFVNG